MWGAVSVGGLSHSGFKNMSLKIKSFGLTSVDICHLIHEAELGSPGDHALGNMAERIKPVTIRVASIYHRGEYDVQS